MCRVIDVATHAINRSIELRNKFSEDRYYLDFYKLNKLLYLAQGTMLAEKDCQLFKDEIYAYTCGPYIKELECFFNEWEYEPIIRMCQQEFILPISVAMFVDNFFEKFGKYNKQELGVATKSQSPWKNAYTDGSLPKVIELNDIKDYFSKIKDLDAEIRHAISQRKTT